jgi:hypothetical protein
VHHGLVDSAYFVAARTLHPSPRHGFDDAGLGDAAEIVLDRRPGDLDSLPALGRNFFGRSLQLLGDEAIEQRHILPSAAVVVLEQVAQDGAAASSTVRASCRRRHRHRASWATPTRAAGAASRSPASRNAARRCLPRSCLDCDGSGRRGIDRAECRPTRSSVSAIE